MVQNYLKESDYANAEYVSNALDLENEIENAKTKAENKSMGAIIWLKKV